MKQDWRQIPIPDLMKDLPLDSRGFPVPVIILHDPEGKPLFTVNDSRAVAHCAYNDLCSVCGKKLSGDAWVLGGPMSAFHERGAFNDIPVHHACGTYALQVCPYLVLSTYRSIDLATKMNEKYGDQAIFINPTQDSTRVPFFVFAKITGYQVSRGYVKPDQPYLAVEFWLNGEQIPMEQAQKLLDPSLGLKVYDGNERTPAGNSSAVEEARV